MTHPNIYIIIQSIWIEVERVKRQKLNFKLKRVKSELVPKNKLIGDFRSTVAQLQYSIEVTIFYMKANLPTQEWLYTGFYSVI